MKFTEELRQRLANIEEKLTDNTTHLAVYNEQLKDHMKRTEIQEDKSEKVEERVIKLETRNHAVNVVFKVLLSIASLGASFAAIIHYLL